MTCAPGLDARLAEHRPAPWRARGSPQGADTRARSWVQAAVLTEFAGTRSSRNLPHPAPDGPPRTPLTTGPRRGPDSHGCHRHRPPAMMTRASRPPGGHRGTGPRGQEALDGGSGADPITAHAEKRVACIGEPHAPAGLTRR